MRKNRTEIAILLEILMMIEQNELSLGQIFKRANVPYTRLVSYIETLKKQKFIEEVNDLDNVEYRISEQGRAFVRECKKFSRLLDIYGLRFVMFIVNLAQIFILFIFILNSR